MSDVLITAAVGVEFFSAYLVYHGLTPCVLILSISLPVISLYQQCALMCSFQNFSFFMKTTLIQSTF